jgi:hypothetical protein
MTLFFVGTCEFVSMMRNMSHDVPISHEVGMDLENGAEEW